MTAESEKMIEKLHKAKWTVEQKAKAVENELNGQYKGVKPKADKRYKKDL